MTQQGPWYQVGVAVRRLLLGLLGQGSGRGRADEPAPGPRPRGKSSSSVPGVRTTKTTTTPGGSSSARATRPSTAATTGAAAEEPSPGRFGAGATRDLAPAEAARVRFEYAPNPDGDPDPGEVVWTWVPYVENDGRGKDRPVLIIGRLDATAVVGCYLSTKAHRDFVSVGRGAWDAQGRESFLSPERLLRITDGGMRREGVRLDRERFIQAARAVAAWHGLRG